MKVKEAMTRPAKVLVPSIPVGVALAYMNSKRIHRMPVVSRGILVGIVTQSDLVRATLRRRNKGQAPEATVEDVMTWSPVTVRPDVPLKEAARTMAVERLRALPVTVARRVVGMITQTDVIRQATRRRTLFTADPVRRPLIPLF